MIVPNQIYSIRKITMEIRQLIKDSQHSIVAIGVKEGENKLKILGSGFALDANGKIASAAHMFIKSGVDLNQLMVMVPMEVDQHGLERFRWLPVQLEKQDIAHDVAILQVSNLEGSLLKPVKLRDTSEVSPGDDVVFIGFPYAAQLIKDGFGITRIATRAMVTNVKRSATAPHDISWLMIDGVSNPGNSGCPLFDVKTGETIGMMSISFKTASQVYKNLDIREPMHICAAKPSEGILANLELGGEVEAVVDIDRT